MVEIKTNDDLIDLCFKDEKEDVENPGLNSILFILRREIKHCFGIKPETGEPNGIYAKWPGTMAIMAGIDLLAKYYIGTLDIQKSGPRFKKFIEDFWDINNTEQEIIYQLRNSLLHSFALYSIDTSGNEYKFTLTESSDKMIDSSCSNNYLININKLCDAFFCGIEKYKNQVMKDEKLKTNLAFVFCKIGVIKFS